MYNLLMRYAPWTEGLETFSRERVFEYTETSIEARFENHAGLDLAALQELPCLFAQETSIDEHQFARVGRILSPRIIGREIQFEVVYERSTPPIPHAELIRLARNLQISTTGRGLTEFNRSHWAVKDVDLYRVLYTETRQHVRAPNIFRLQQHPHIDPNLVSVMMPFGSELLPIYHAIQSACAGLQLACNRADNIWQNPAIIDDVVNLIDRSAVVIFDCSGKNANVFYELGLAHAWGKEVIIITNDPADIPFDLRHIRYITYRCDQLNQLGTALSVKLRELTR